MLQDEDLACRLVSVCVPALVRVLSGASICTPDGRCTSGDACCMALLHSAQQKRLHSIKHHTGMLNRRWRWRTVSSMRAI
eukprot:9488205-Pyramimonas_sp.AAC.1